MMDNSFVSKYREMARRGLEGQWGIMILLRIGKGACSVGAALLLSFFPFGGTILSGVVSIFFLFMLNYSIEIASLIAARGGSVSMGVLFSVFHNIYYWPLLALSCMHVFIRWLILLILFLPIAIVQDFSYFLQITFLGAIENYLDLILNMGTASLLILFLFGLFLLVNIMLEVFFRFTVWSKVDFPDISLLECLKYALELLRGRCVEYIGLQLSFAGWYLLVFFLSIGIQFLLGLFGGAIILRILYLVLSVYVDVSVASFFDTAQEEVGSPSMF